MFYSVDNIFTFVKESWGVNPKAGDKLVIGFSASKARDAKVVPLTMSFTIDDS